MGLTHRFRASMIGAASMAGAVFLLGSAGVAAADTITLNWIPGSITTFAHPGTSAASGSGSGAIPPELLFDPALGSLDAVDVRYVGAGLVGKTLDVAPGSYTVVASLDIRLAHDPTGFEVLLSAPLGFSDVTVTEAGPFLFTEGNSRILPLTGTQGLDVFVTGGTLDLMITGVIQVFGPGGLIYDGIGDSMTGDSRIGDSITYTYTPIPEPGTAVLAGAGLAMLAMRGRRVRTSRRTASQ